MASNKRTRPGKYDSARFGQSSNRGDANIQVRVDAGELLHLIDRETGRFRRKGFQQALADVHVEAAQVVQKGMAAELDAKVGRTGTYGYRPQRPGRRLQTSLLNDQNREVFANTFTVGIPHWLDRSPAALYWRQIEEGTAGYSTNALFTDEGGPGGIGSPAPMSGHPHWARPNEGGPHMRMAQFRPFEGRTKGVFIHVRGITAFRYSRGGLAGYRDFTSKVDMADRYIRALRAAGFTVSRDKAGGFFKQ